MNKLFVLAALIAAGLTTSACSPESRAKFKADFKAGMERSLQEQAEYNSPEAQAERNRRLQEVYRNYQTRDICWRMGRGALEFDAYWYQNNCY